MQAHYEGANGAHVQPLGHRRNISVLPQPVLTILPGVRNIKDALGIWTGKRQFRVLLREDESGYDGYRHPPASFTIGADRGYLMYAGQPRFCKKCSTYGHLADARNCGTLGHVMRDCTVSKRCSLCNSEDHLFRHCPKAERGRRGRRHGTTRH